MRRAARASARPPLRPSWTPGKQNWLVGQAPCPTNMNRHRMYINGERVESHRGAWFPVYDPSTEEIIAEVPDADAADIDRAVAGRRGRLRIRSRGRRPPRRIAAACSSNWPSASARTRRPWPNWNRAIAASPSWKPNTTSTIRPPVSNTTAAWPPRSWGTSTRYPTTPSASRCASRWAWRARSSPGIIRC